MHRRLLLIHRTMTVTPISVVWSVLSILIAAACWFSLLQPYWFLHPESLTSLGVYSYCLVKDDRPASNSEHSNADEQPLHCSAYGGHFQFSNLPSGAWQAACVLYGSGCVLMAICALLSLVVLCLGRKKDRRLALFTGYVQIVSATLYTGGLIIFPAGLDASFVQHHCRDSGMYWSGSCVVGWAYILGIVADALAIFCPFLSHHIDTVIH